MIVRQWEMVVKLCERRRGMTVGQISEQTGTSRATIYRDLKLLREAGAPLVSKRINGETRYQILGQSYPPLIPTSLQLMALHLARHLMSPLAGTRLFTELDGLLTRYSPTRDIACESIAIGSPAPNSYHGEVQRIDRAIHYGKRIAFGYQSVNQSQAQTRCVDPISLRVHDSQLYLIAYDIERSDFRTFKVARIDDIDILDQSADPHPDYDEQALFAHSAKVWTGEPVHVAVRLSAHVARFADEWPLTLTQTIETNADGSVVVAAQVAGIVEAMRWVLRWGMDAEALAPAELRHAVHQQLAHAIKKYQPSVA